MALYLGIDGGGTKTNCAVGDEESLLGTGTSGGSNVIRLGEDRARASLQAAILSACSAAAVHPAQIARTFIGVAGASVPQVREVVMRCIAEVVSGEVTIVGDHEIALAAAFGEAPGVVVASGTGSIAYGRNEQGRVARAGGHGWAVSDEGSGHWIGHAAVAAVLRSIDCAQGTPLTRLIMEALVAPTEADLVRVANATPAPDFACLFPLVVRAAESRDAVAGGLLINAALQLAELAGIVIGKLWAREPGFGVGMVGSVFGNSGIVRTEFCNIITRLHPEAKLNSFVTDPVSGALSLARRGVPMTT